MPINKRVLTVFVGGLVACMMSACAGPRAVVNITSRGDQVKMVYYQQTFMGYDQGIVKCKAADDGKLSECRKLKVNFKDK